MTIYNTQFESETSISIENITTETTIFDNTTISIPSNGLSDGVIVGIVISIIVGILALVLMGFLLYKYRPGFRDSKQSNNRFTSDKVNNIRPNITYSPEHEYLTVNIFTLSKDRPSADKSARSNTNST